MSTNPPVDLLENLPETPQAAATGPNRLLEHVIADANAKGAGITTFKILPNGKTVLYFKAEKNMLPQYYGSRYCVIDSLIHRYNLKRHYPQLLSCFGTQPNHVSAANKRKPALARQKSVEDRAVDMCDDILHRHKGFELFKGDHNRIYAILDNLERDQKTMSYATFQSVKRRLVSHYRQKMDDTDSVVNRVKLKQIVNFFADMQYHDLL